MERSLVERSLEVYAVIHLTVMGLSRTIHHRAWAEFFILLRGAGRPGVFAHGFLSLAFGSMILAFHPVWSGSSLNPEPTSAPRRRDECGRG